MLRADYERIVMLDRNDLWKIAVAVLAVIGAIASHTLHLPTSLMPYASGIEFTCEAISIGAAVFINKPGGTTP